MNSQEIKQLHSALLTGWNNQSAASMTSLFCEDGYAIGFDESQMNGRGKIQEKLEKIFKDHHTASYVWKIEDVKFLSSTIALLRAIVGMIPSGKSEVNPEKNAIQSVVASLENNSWKIALFQNTPARFDG
jgi:uncharacterized protein (TIGR02246 family)